MQKSRAKLIGAIGFLSMSGVAFAQSSVTLFGVVDDGVSYTNSQSSLTGSAASGKHNVQLAQSVWIGNRFGLVGREEVGDGTAVIFKLLSRFNLNTGAGQYSGAMFAQQSWIGLTNQRYGKLTLGRQYTPYVQYLIPYSQIEWVTAFYGAHPGDIDSYDTDYKVSNTVEYETPSFHGLKMAAAYSLGGVAGNMGRGSSWSAAIRYARGPFGIAAAIERFNNSTVGGGKWGADSTAANGPTQQGLSALTIGYQTNAAQQRIAVTGKYALTTDFDVAANYSNVQYIPGINSAFKSTAIWNTIGAAVHWRVKTVWDLAVSYSYTRATQANGIYNAAHYNQIVLTEYYNLSKRTGLYAAQAYQRASGLTLAADGKSIIGARATIGTGFNNNPSAGSTQVALGVGIVHRF
ncbi:porin [Burkholderia anthina]|uniref:porin n=1 Tax=Burkholderia anthina TaxID=179879 RepID=UPI00158AB057|nr:porin [Burkholderia anthina]